MDLELFSQTHIYTRTHTHVYMHSLSFSYAYMHALYNIIYNLDDCRVDFVFAANQEEAI